MKKELSFKGIIERVEYSHSRFRKFTIIFLKGKMVAETIVDVFVNLKAGDEIEYNTLSGWVKKEWKFKTELIVNGIKILTKDDD